MKFYPNGLNLCCHPRTLIDAGAVVLTGKPPPPCSILRQVYHWKTCGTPANATQFAKTIPDLKVTLD